MKNKGFIATSLVYSLFIAFTLLMTYTINKTLQTGALSSKFNDMIKNSNNLQVSNNETLIDHITSLVSSYSNSSTGLINLGTKNDYAPIKLYDTTTYSDGTTEVIISATTSKCTMTLAYDGTNDNNLRYVGTNPCNFVKFNNEMWRIIGVMNNIDDGTGKKETRIKLVRSETIGEMHFDSKCRWVGNSWSCYYNYWPGSEIQIGLNGDYLNVDLHENTKWNASTGTVYDHQAIYNFRFGLKTKAQSQIDNAIWLFRAAPEWYSASEYYSKEHGNPTNILDTNWTGKVALIYPSDYGFAAGGEKRDNCLRTYLEDYNKSGCLNYLINSDTLMADSSDSEKIYWTGGRGLDSTSTRIFGKPRPCVYLKSSVAYLSGDGTYNNPFTID